MSADDIPVAHTPPGGYGRHASTVLFSCTEPLVGGAPDLRGLWRAVSVTVGGVPAPDHPARAHVERIEQCGDRIVITAGGVVHDMRCDGTEEHGVHDVAEFDHTTVITVVATYDNGVHVLRPVGLPGVEVTRRIDGDHLVWTYVGFVARLERGAFRQSRAGGDRPGPRRTGGSGESLIVGVGSRPDHCAHGHSPSLRIRVSTPGSLQDLGTARRCLPVS